jgi:hypothetical protein
MQDSKFIGEFATVKSMQFWGLILVARKHYKVTRGRLHSLIVILTIRSRSLLCNRAASQSIDSNERNKCLGLLPVVFVVFAEELNEVSLLSCVNVVSTRLVTYKGLQTVETHP